MVQNSFFLTSTLLIQVATVAYLLQVTATCIAILHIQQTLQRISLKLNNKISEKKI